MSNETVKESYADRVAKIRALKAEGSLVDVSSMTCLSDAQSTAIQPGSEKDWGTGIIGKALDKAFIEETNKCNDIKGELTEMMLRQSRADIDYRTKVMDEVTRLTEPPYTTQVIGGIEVKVYPPNYFNSDYIALKWFCESVHFDKEICDELLFNKNGNEFRVSVTDIGLATLAHWRCK